MRDNELLPAQTYAQQFRAATVDRLGTDEAAAEKAIIDAKNQGVWGEFVKELGGEEKLLQIVDDEFSWYEKDRMVDLIKTGTPAIGSRFERFATGSLNAISNMGEGFVDNPALSGTLLVGGLVAAAAFPTVTAVGLLAGVLYNTFELGYDLGTAYSASTPAKENDALQSAGGHFTSAVLFAIPFCKAFGSALRGGAAGSTGASQAARAVAPAIAEDEAVTQVLANPSLPKGTNHKIPTVDLQAAPKQRPVLELVVDEETLPELASEAGPAPNDIPTMPRVPQSVMVGVGRDGLNKELIAHMMSWISRGEDVVYLGEGPSYVDYNASSGVVSSVRIPTSGQGHAKEIVAEILSWMRSRGVTTNGDLSVSNQLGRTIITISGTSASGETVSAVVSHPYAPIYPRSLPKNLLPFVNEFRQVHGPFIMHILSRRESSWESTKALNAYHALTRVTKLLGKQNLSEKEMEQMQQYSRILTDYAAKHPVTDI